MDFEIKNLNCGGGKTKLSGAQKRKLKKLNNTVNENIPKEPIRVINNFKQYMIVPDEYPEKKLSNWQFEQIKLEVLKVLNTSDVSENIKYRGGFKITCNPSILEHLNNTVNNLNISQLNLKLIDIKDVPVYTKIMILINGDPEDPEIVLKKFETENEMSTNNWKLIHREVADKSQRLVYSLDQESIKILDKLEFKPFLNHQRIKLKLLVKERKSK